MTLPRAGRTAPGIASVGSSLDLTQVLENIVGLLSSGPPAHSCFVWLLDESGDRLELRVTSSNDEWTDGEIALERGDGLAWWSLENREVGFIADDALHDPQAKVVPGFSDNRFQSLVCVPVYGRDGRGIGVISMRCEARDLPAEEIDSLASAASLVAGAIENANLYQEVRRRVHELEDLTRLGEAIAQAQTLDELLPAVVSHAADLFGATACHVYLLDRTGEKLLLRASTPWGSDIRQVLPLSAIAKRRRRGGLAVPLATGDDVLGLLVAEGTRELGLAQAVASQTAVAIEKIALIDRLTERNLIRDFFERLAGGETGAKVDHRASTLGCDLTQPHVVLVAASPGPALERSLAGIAPGSLFEGRDEPFRALLRIPSGGERALIDKLRDLGTPAGLSSVCCDANSYAAAFAEARYALLGAQLLGTGTGAIPYDELGAYKYVFRMSLELGVRDRHRDALLRLAEHDRERQTSLLRSLEEFLRRRGSFSAAADTLYVHPNTLRQRLMRIQELTGIDLKREDWLMIEIAIKLVRIQQNLDVHTHEALDATRTGS